MNDNVYVNNKTSLAQLSSSGSVPRLGSQKHTYTYIYKYI